MISITGISLGSFGFAPHAPSALSAEPAVEVPQNVQTLTILKATLNINPNAYIGGGDIATVGDVALLSEAGPSGTPTERTVINPGQISVYVVREGDTLSQIAHMFSVSVNTIKWANDLNSKGTIAPGDVLVILPVSGVRHTVQEGETIKGIVEKYSGDLEEVLAFNNVSSGATISTGDVITVPDGEIEEPVESTSRTVAKKVAPKVSSTPSVAGYFMRPINGTRTQGRHGYNAVDIGAPVGTSIFAAADGTVIVSKDYGWNGGYGKYVVIKHDNGTQTLYAHNSSNIVGVGQRVVQGQIIGYVGSTGKSTGPHLHFEVRGAANPF